MKYPQGNKLNILILSKRNITLNKFWMSESRSNFYPMLIMNDQTKLLEGNDV